MNVPTENELKRLWWAEQPEKAQELYREWPELGRTAFKFRGMVEWVVRVKSDGSMGAVVYEQNS